MFFDDPDGILAIPKTPRRGPGYRRPIHVDPGYLLDGRTGYFFEIQPSGLMGDGLLRAGGNVQQGLGRRVGGARPASRQWVVCRDPDSLEHPELQPRVGHMGYQLPTNHTSQTGGDPLDGAPENRGVVATHPRRTPDGPLGHVPGHRSRVKPYVVAGWTRQTTLADSTSYPRDLGFDVGYSITPSCEPRRPSIPTLRKWKSTTASEPHSVFPPVPRTTRFLPRKGRESSPSHHPENGVEPYFSRRIGLRGGNPVPIQFGTRLGGQAGATRSDSSR